MDVRKRLIELLGHLEYQYCQSHSIMRENVVDHLLAKGVTIREPGEWILVIEPNEDGNAQYMCSRCGWGDTHAPTMEVPYCWKCGAPMKGESK